MLIFLKVSFYLLCVHALCDYALQSVRMEAYKRPITSKLSGDPWWWTMTAHCLINALGVSLVTHPMFGALEFLTHMLADTSKCLGKISSHADQAIHVGSKILWGILYVIYQGQI